jgi:hypothetical protein
MPTKATINMDRQEIDELVAKSTPEWAAKKVGSAIGKFAKENVHRVPKERKNLEQPPHKPKDPVIRRMAERAQKVGEHMRSHYKMKPGEFEKYQGIADAEARRTSKSIDEQTSEYFAKCHSHVLDGMTEDELKNKKKEAPKADGHVFGSDPNDKRGSDMEMVKKKEPDAYKSLDERTADLHKAVTGNKKVKTGDVDQHDDHVRSTESSKIEGGKRVGPGTDRFTHTSHDPEKGEVKITTSNWNKKTQKYEHGETTHPTHVRMGSGTEANQDLPKKSLIATVDELLEKSGVRQVHRVKDQGAASKVKKIDPKTLSHDRQQQLLSGSAAKVKAYREEGYVPDKDDTPEVREQDRDPSNKSLTSTLDDLLKSMYDIVHHKRFSKMDPDAGINKKKEEAMERGPSDKGDYKPGSKTFNNPQDSQDPKIRYKSLDDRTCDLVKSIDTQRAKEIRDAALTVRLSREGISSAASKMDVKPEDVHRVETKLTGLHAARESSLKSVCDMWIGETSMIKGHTILPGNAVGDLAKDERKPGGRTPTLQQTDEKQREVETGSIYRRQKAEKRVNALKEEQAFGSK